MVPFDPSRTALRLLVVVAALLAGAFAWAGDEDPYAIPAGDPWHDDLAPAQPPDRGRPGAGLVFKTRLNPEWAADESWLWYRVDLPAGAREFIAVDTATGLRAPAFDHARLAKSLGTALGTPLTPDHLPIDQILALEPGKSIRLRLDSTVWVCDLTTYACKKTGETARPAPEPSPGRRRSRPPEDEPQAGAILSPQSPDGKWTGFIQDHDLWIKSTSGPGEPVRLSTDGRPGMAYERMSWAGDSRHLVAFKVEPGDRKPVYLIQSSPPGGGRATLSTRPYDLPGDKLQTTHLILFDTAKRAPIATTLDPIDLDQPRIRWRADKRHFTYQKIDRGHQRFRLIEVDSQTGKARTIIDEMSKTFIWTAHRENVALRTITWINDSELVYASERDGWRHLYLVDVDKGAIRNPITHGEYVVRGIDRVDAANREVWFHASGMNPGQDPYFLHYYRVGLGGGRPVSLTSGDGDHAIQLSPQRRFLIDTYSRVDAPPIHELRKTADGSLVRRLEQADATALLASGWKPPEVFTAKGRDGKTDIWGVIWRPRQFDPNRKYPVVEQIYAGPQGSYVPKSHSPASRYADLADLGFIVVQMDGMGTANRSKAFHDVCWHDLKDAGFADRILWHQAVARKYPYYDINRVGLVGVSAGGQNAAGGVLFHPEFYKVAVAACGCHDNRMDKASWNEQWMGYPVGPHYAASSNIDNAGRLQGRLLLIVGEMDNNVPPESTMRLADALIKADKEFDLVVVPGAGHGMGGAHGARKMREFFVRHLGPPSSEGDTTPSAGASVSTPPVHTVESLIDGYSVDLASLSRSLPPSAAPQHDQRMGEFTREGIAALSRLDFRSLDDSAQIDYLLFKNHLNRELARIDKHAADRASGALFVPFAPVILDLEQARRQLTPLDWAQTAGRIDALVHAIDHERHSREKGPTSDKALVRAAGAGLGLVDELRGVLREWFAFYDGYDPLFTWWLQAPYKAADSALESYSTMLKDHYHTSAVGLGDEGGRGRRMGRGGRGGGPPPEPTPSSSFSRGQEIVGRPIGREALVRELESEMIAYAPEELLDLAEREMRWCEAEMKKAAREMGKGDDWRAALEQVKSLHVEPGKQPALIRDLALEAVDYLDQNNLVTIPQLCRDSWRMAMMSPERQLVNPFFTGGETITVSFPTSSMAHEAKMMSLRGNNIHFARATVHHELIPGHHLQMFMNARNKTYRRMFSTPFSVEGWALYWELLLWDRGFAKSPENKVGMLFWRMHRCARILFSLGFHLEKLTPKQCVDMLVDRVGHERDNAEAEVRRSFETSYGPLYQAAYLLGGMQIRALHRELVESGAMTERAFHDAILRENAIPIEMLRAALTHQRLTPDHKPSWRFAESRP